MYYYGTGNCNYQMPYSYPTCSTTGSNYAIILVLFILLVIVIGCRYTQ